LADPAHDLLKFGEIKNKISNLNLKNPLALCRYFCHSFVPVFGDYCCGTTIGGDQPNQSVPPLRSKREAGKWGTLAIGGFGCPV
jgi:hypothetical protein